MNKLIVLPAIFSFLFLDLQAQHDHSQPEKKESTQAKDEKNHLNEPMDSMQMMTHSYSLNLPMNRNSSGTAWQPDATSMYGYMMMGDKWDVMVSLSVCT